VVLVPHDCHQGDPQDLEGMVCANDGAEDQAYCTYAHSPTSCVYCSEYREYVPDVYQPPRPGFGADDHVEDNLALLRVVEDVCPEQYAECEADPVTTGAEGRAGGCMADVMNLIEYSEEPPPNPLVDAVLHCMETAMESPSVVHDVTAIMCGGDACCACTMGCMDDEECMSSCFDHNADGSRGDCAAELYDDSDWGGAYSDPCDQCIMECDSMLDWSATQSTDTEYEMCMDGCYNAQYGACRGIWSDVPELHPCDACLLGCHEGEPPWLDPEIALGRPFLVDPVPSRDGDGDGAHSSAALAQALEVAACSSSDWIIPM